MLIVSSMASSGFGQSSDKDLALGASDVVRWMAKALHALSAHQAELNRINVFEIPDGDTGDNLVRTVRYGYSAVEELSSGATMADVCTTLSRAMWMNSSGASGLILGSALSAMLAQFARSDAIGAAQLVAGLRAAATAARAAVTNPVRGTMVTVMEDVALAAETATPEMDTVVAAARAAGRAAVDRTTAQLLLLARAGVVDAGGFGLRLILEALFDVALEV